MGQMRLLLQSPCSQQPFVLVEGTWDCALYRKLLIGHNVNVGRAYNNGYGGYHYVETIVKEISSSFPKAKVIGIRDSDYTRFEKDYKQHPLIFMTDAHSLEMMLLSSRKVFRSLSAKWISFDAQYSEILPDARHIALFYIYSVMENLKLDFEKNKMRLYHFVDSNGKMKKNWKANLSKKFFNLPECRGYSPAQMNTKIKYIGPDRIDDCTLCRGHDVLNTCYKRIPHGDLTISDIMKVMIDAYSMDDFMQTELCKNLKKWQKEKHVSLFAE